jgi:threonine synthase
MPTPTALRCIRCERHYPLTAYARGCAACETEGVGANLTVAYEALPALARPATPSTDRSMWRFDALLHARALDAVTLGEGGTPLVPVPRLGLGNLYLKDETRNPTWSFKDRLASGAVTMAKRLGARVIASSSSGNAGAAAAAYAAKAGLPCVICTYAQAAGPMIAQMQSYGALLVSAPTSADRWRLIAAGVREYGWYPASVYYGPAVGSNPFGVEGYKTIAYEIAESLGWRAPDWCVLPVCYGDSLYGMWKGFDEMRRLGWTASVPRFVAAEVSGSISAAMASGVAMPPAQTLAAPSVATSIGAQQGTHQALAALRASNGVARRVADADILAWRSRLARREGIFAEISAAATLPAIDGLRRDGTIADDASVVALLTAPGLKDAPTDAPRAPRVSGDLAEAMRVLKEHYGFDG